MSNKIERKQITFYLSEDLLDRIDAIVDAQQVRTNRTFFITMAILEYIKRMEDYGSTDITEIPN
jgi:predicted transcriptional regulator